MFKKQRIKLNIFKTRGLYSLRYRGLNSLRNRG